MGSFNITTPPARPEKPVKKLKRVKDVAKVLAKVTGKDVPYRKLAVADLEPNDWNPNKLNAEGRTKLLKGMTRLLDQGVPLPPVVVRPHPTKEGMFEIIDGFHRWDILRSEGVEGVDTYVIDVDTPTAMLLTNTLNYLRGEADPELQANYLHRLIQEQQMPLPEAAEYLPYTESEIEAQLAAYDLDIVEVPVPAKDPSDSDGSTEDAFLTLKFTVSQEQAEVIERELARIASLITGRNLRGRSLEYMAVISSQIEADNLTGVAALQELTDAPQAPSNLRVKSRVRRS